MTAGSANILEPFLSQSIASFRFVLCTKRFLNSLLFCLLTSSSSSRWLWSLSTNNSIAWRTIWFLSVLFFSFCLPKPVQFFTQIIVDCCNPCDHPDRLISDLLKSPKGSRHSTYLPITFTRHSSVMRQHFESRGLSCYGPSISRFASHKNKMCFPRFERTILIFSFTFLWKTCWHPFAFYGINIIHMVVANAARSFENSQVV